MVLLERVLTRFSSPRESSDKVWFAKRELWQGMVLLERVLTRYGSLIELLQLELEPGSTLY